MKNFDNLMSTVKRLTVENENESNWSMIDKTLLELSKTEEKHMMNVMEICNELLLRSMLSERSKLSGSAVILGRRLLEILKEKFLNIDRYLECCFKLMARPNRVFNLRAKEFLEDIAKVVNIMIYNRIIKDSISSISKRVRAAAFNTLSVYIKTNKIKKIKLGGLLNQIEKGKGDPDPECRNICKDIIKYLDSIENEEDVVEIKPVIETSYKPIIQKREHVSVPVITEEKKTIEDDKKLGIRKPVRILESFKREPVKGESPLRKIIRKTINTNIEIQRPKFYTEPTKPIEELTPSGLDKYLSEYRRKSYKNTKIIKSVENKNLVESKLKKISLNEEAKMNEIKLKVQSIIKKQQTVIDDEIEKTKEQNKEEQHNSIEMREVLKQNFNPEVIKEEVENKENSPKQIMEDELQQNLFDGEKITELDNHEEIHENTPLIEQEEINTNIIKEDINKSVIENTNIIKEDIIENNNIIKEEIIEIKKDIKEEITDIVENTIELNNNNVKENIIEIKKDIIENNNNIKEDIIDNNNIIEIKKDIIENNNNIKEDIIENNNIIKEDINKSVIENNNNNIIENNEIIDDSIPSSIKKEMYNSNEINKTEDIINSEDELIEEDRTFLSGRLEDMSLFDHPDVLIDNNKEYKNEDENTRENNGEKNTSFCNSIVIDNLSEIKDELQMDGYKTIILNDECMLDNTEKEATTDALSNLSAENIFFEEKNVDDLFTEVESKVFVNKNTMKRDEL